jgi:hypothetical protein
MFSLYAHEVEPEQRFEAATSVSRLAVAGQAGMMALYNQIVDRNLDSGAFPIGTRVHITMLAELMDESAAFGLQSDMWDDSELRQRCAGIGWQAQSASHPETGPADPTAGDSPIGQGGALWRLGIFQRRIPDCAMCNLTSL